MSGLVARLRALASWQVTLFGALVALGFLVAVQVRAEVPRVRYTTQERAPLVETVLELQAQQEDLKQQVLDLRARMTAAEERVAGSDQQVRDINEALLGARVAAGLVALEGPGLVLQLDDSQAPVPPGAAAADYRVSAADLRVLVDELWLAGAEAVAVNGERIVSSTAILDIGGSILVNSAYLAPPYQVAAIGPPDLYEQMSASPGFVALVADRADGFGIGLSFGQPDSVVIPAYAGAVAVRYARQPAPSPTAEP